MSNQPVSQEQADHLALQAAYKDDRMYSNFSHFLADVESPLFQRSEAFRTLCEERLRQSQHVWLKGDQAKISNVEGDGGSGSQSLAVRVKADGTTEVCHPGAVGRSKPSDAPAREGADNEPTIETRGGSTIVSVRSE